MGPVFRERRKIMVRQLRKGGFVCFGWLMVLLLGSQFVSAQDYPTKPVILVIPMGAGGSHDLTARAVTSVAADYLGQPIIIQLKPGGGGAIGTEFVAKAPPDGYTLLLEVPVGRPLSRRLKEGPRGRTALRPYAGSIIAQPPLSPGPMRPTRPSRK